MEATRQKLVDKSSAVHAKNPVKTATVNPKTLNNSGTIPSITTVPSNSSSVQHDKVMVYGYTESYAVNPDVDIFIVNNMVGKVGHNSMVPVYISKPCELKFKCSLSFGTTQCFAHPGDVVVLSLSRMSGKLSATLTSHNNYTNVIQSKQKEDSKNSMWVFILIALGSLITFILANM